MTYAESKGLPNIDWEYFLNHPPQTPGGWKLAEKAALSFTQDPGGCLDATLPREENGEITDITMRYAGRNFAVAILNKNLAWAKKLLANINERATMLLIRL